MTRQLVTTWPPSASLVRLRRTEETLPRVVGRRVTTGRIMAGPTAAGVGV